MYKVQEAFQKTMSNKETIVERAARIAGTGVPELENLKKDKETKKGKHGGVRPNSGRKEGGTALQKRLLKQAMVEHLEEEVDVTVRDRRTGKEHTVKKPRIQVILERLFNFSGTHYQAADLWLNRAVGRAPQPLIGDVDEAPVQIDLGIGRILDKAYGDPESE